MSEDNRASDMMFFFYFVAFSAFWYWLGYHRKFTLFNDLIESPTDTPTTQKPQFEVIGD